MLILRVRQAEVALADGRLDEAYQLVIQHNLAIHRRGQRLITKLAAALVKRGNVHLMAGHFVDALSDGEKAAKIAGSLPDIVALRSVATDGLAQHQKQEHQQQRLIGEAKRRVEQGCLDAGSQLLADALADMTRVGLLRSDIQGRRTAAAVAAKHAKTAHDRGQLHAAADEILAAQAVHPHDSAILNLKNEIATDLLKQVRSCFTEGHLHRAGDLLARLTRLDPDNPETKALILAADHLHDAWRHVSNHELAEARMILARVGALVSNLRWLQSALAQLEQAEDALTQIRTGPLAWLKPHDAPPAPAPAPTINYNTRPIAARMLPVTAAPNQLVLHVDGIGSFLVLRDSTVTIGPLSASASVDVGLIAEPNLPPIKVQRLDEDYFLNSTASGKPTLLTSGQKVELSLRCRLTFAVPNPASTSAVLDLSGAKLPRSDIRRIVLMDHDLIIGPGPSAHVPAPNVREPVVLYVRNHQIYCRTNEPMQINQEPADVRNPLPLGANVRIGELSFVLLNRSQDTR